MNIINIHQPLLLNENSKLKKNLKSFGYLHNFIIKKEVYSQKLNSRYIKYYKWIDKKNWGLVDMNFNNSEISPFTSSTTRLIFQPPFCSLDQFTDIWKNIPSRIYRDLNFQNTRYGLVVTTQQLEISSERNAKQKTIWHHFFKHNRPDNLSGDIKNHNKLNRSIDKPKIKTKH
jgi:hypothetical protein